MKVNERLKSRSWGVKRIGYGDRPLVLSVDMQRVDTDEDSPSPFGAHMAGFHLMRRSIIGQRKLMDVARSKNIQIAYTREIVRKDGKDVGRWKLPLTTVYTVDSKWSEICPELEPREEDIVIIKSMPSAFFGTELLNIMIANRFDTLIVVGGSTSGCIRATVIDSFSYGFRTIIPEDCVGDIAGEEPHWTNLSDMDARYADVVDLDDVLKYFNRLPKQNRV